MASSVEQRVAVVTGGGRGMGRAICLALAEKGLRVVAASRTASDLEETAALGGDAVGSFVCDLAEPAQVGALFAHVGESCGRLNVLVCSQGIYQSGAPALELPLDQFDRTMAVNLRSAFLCAQHAGRAMREGGRGGRIVFISSMNGQLSQTHAADYDTSKAALNGLTRALAVELAPEWITVNAIAPGWVRTAMSRAEIEELEQEDLVVNPLRRFGEVEQIAGAALWLTDPGSDFVTGAIVNVDGGQTAMLPMPWNPAGVAGPGATGAAPPPAPPSTRPGARP